MKHPCQDPELDKYTIEELEAQLNMRKMVKDKCFNMKNDEFRLTYHQNGSTEMCVKGHTIWLNKKEIATLADFLIMVQNIRENDS